jgi:hypothetical protein
LYMVKCYSPSQLKVELKVKDKIYTVCHFKTLKSCPALSEEQWWACVYILSSVQQLYKALSLFTVSMLVPRYCLFPVISHYSKTQLIQNFEF